MGRTVVPQRTRSNLLRHILSYVVRTHPNDMTACVACVAYRYFEWSRKIIVYGNAGGGMRSNQSISTCHDAIGYHLCRNLGRYVTFRYLEYTQISLRETYSKTFGKPGFPLPRA